MIKITTFFKKDLNDLSRVINEIDPLNEWVLLPSTKATRKFDGSACAIIYGVLYKRYDAKKGKKAPEGAIPCQAPDLITGHHPHWVRCDRNKPEDRLFFEGYDNMNNQSDGTFELIGEKVNSNPEKIKGHQIIRHGVEVLFIPDLSFEGIKRYLANPLNDIEGVVFHGANGEMCKIRKCDFGIKR